MLATQNATAEIFSTRSATRQQFTPGIA